MTHHATVLVVEDDRPLQDALVSTLETAGFNVLAAADGGEALKVLNDTAVDLIVSDVQMQPVDGRELLRRLQQRPSSPPVLLMTAYGTIDQAVAAMRDGAVDYLVKPFEAEELERRVARYARPAAAAARGGSAPVAEDPRSRALLALAQRVAQGDVTVLLQGESGTGKEVLARFIHNRSPRSQRPFVAVNCAAIPENMLEALLFGYERGAFTGAATAHAGKFEQAQGGTLLLDEITEMPMSLQAKLLRVLQEREVERIGGRGPIPLDVRVIATTNRNLRGEVANGRFREDLFYRLCVFPLLLAPLRERRDDVLPLAMQLLASRCRPGTAIPALSADAAHVLLTYGWPGNIRELDNLLQRALILTTTSVIGPEHIHLESVSAAQTQPAHRPATVTELEVASELRGSLRETERDLILDVLGSGATRSEAANRLGISPRTLRYKLARLRATGTTVPAA
jgi:two-component system response regulator FlrC